MEVDIALTTTRAVRRRLDFDRAVPRTVVEECLELALQAPNGSNQQTWRWILIDDARLRTEIADVYRAVMDEINAGTTARPLDSRMSASVKHLRDHLERAPVMVIPLLSGRLDHAAVADQAVSWGSILPSVWSFMLALRSRDLGSVWTTIHLRRERQVAEILGIPFDEWTQVGLFPVAYTLGTDFKPGPRRPLAEVAQWNGLP
jgi:nitroreductase